jgi:hypothetical protein
MVDVYVQKRYGCSSWNDNKAVIGVMNDAGTLATVAPGRNITETPNWTTFVNYEHIPEAWRFTPLTTPNYEITWYRGEGVDGDVLYTSTYGDYDSIPVECGLYDNEYLTVKLRFTTCSGDEVIFLDTTLIKWEQPAVILYDSICVDNSYAKNYTNSYGQQLHFNIDVNQNRTPDIYKYTNEYVLQQPGLAPHQCCSVTDTLYLKVMDRVRENEDTTICKGETFRGKVYNQSGIYILEADTIPSSVGCDIIVTTTLNVIESVVAEIGEIEAFCSYTSTETPEFITIPYKVLEGIAPAYNITFTGKAADVFGPGGNFPTDGSNITIKIPADTRPDKYTAVVVFGDARCGGESKIPVEFVIQYRRSILEQNWNDVIAILNDKYNGDFKFSKYQWYKDGTAIKDATGSYIYVEDGLDMNAQYSVALTREGEDYAIFTCSIQPSTKTDVSTSPVIVQGQQNIIMVTTTTSGIIKVYDIYGRLMQTQSTANNYAEFTLPAGMYIVEINLDNGSRITEKIAIK